MSISVCIATYNGEKYIKAQLESILMQLGEEDEVVISDDASTDNTIAIIRSIEDPRIRLFTGHRFGSHVYNFEHALKQAKGEYLFLSDQDDIWLPNKVSHTIPLLQTYDLVLSDAVMVDAHGAQIHDSFFRFNHSRKGILKNFYKNSYLGCCMAFRRSVLLKALPFPPDINMHDWWIGMIAEIHFNVHFSDEKLILYRRHQDAVTPLDRRSTNPLLTKIGFRINLLKGLIARW
jgi:glycosyltransferase involved in cell wall biosynthesis